jgi:hypothetical protein
MVNSKKLITVLVLGILALILVWILIFGIELDSYKCISSPYNPSNLTGGVYLFGKCYVPWYETYESTEKCGFLGISCRDVEPYVKMSTGTRCFKLKTGERC